MLCLIYFFVVCTFVAESYSVPKEIAKREECSMGVFSCALRDIMVTVPTGHVGIVIDSFTDDDTITSLTKTFFQQGIMTSTLVVSSNFTQGFLDPLVQDLKKRTSACTEATYLIISNVETSEDIAAMIGEQNFARRNIIFFFYVEKRNFSETFIEHVYEAMRACLIVRIRYGSFQILCNQAKSEDSAFRVVNWWTRKEGVFRSPLLPDPREVYKDFNGRVFSVPVLHKPPWNFVAYNNKSIDVVGRDDKLLKLLAAKLNFQFEYFDPPDKSQGSVVVNGTMQGVLGLIWQREVEFFIGDLTVTYERSQAVDFTFLTLTDSEAFLTHAPGRLNEALALVRPFNWKVWPAVIATFFLTSPLLYLCFLSSNKWREHKKKLMLDCFWIITSIFLKQNIELNLKKFHRVQFLIILLYLVSTYVIGDMYSANLTSMLAKPALEKPITNLEQLNSAMATKGYRLLVEKHSASQSILENGTGLYKSIWEKMKNQQSYLLNSTEEGILIVREDKQVAVIGGRETFSYNTRRFGIHYFHLSEKLYTRYSAIAVQIGCPFIHNFNKILMSLFEAGILLKITEDEYQKLGERSSMSKREDSEGNREVVKKTTKEDDKELKSMSLTTLQGAFYVLLAGHFLAGIFFGIEHLAHHCQNCL